MAKQVLHKHFKDIEVSTLGFGGTRWAMEEAITNVSTAKRALP